MALPEPRFACLGSPRVRLVTRTAWALLLMPMLSGCQRASVSGSARIDSGGDDALTGRVLAEFETGDRLRLVKGIVATDLQLPVSSLDCLTISPTTTMQWVPSTGATSTELRVECRFCFDRHIDQADRVVNSCVRAVESISLERAAVLGGAKAPE